MRAPNDLDPVLAGLIDREGIDLHRTVSRTRKVQLAKAAAAVLGRLVTSAQVSDAIQRIRTARGVEFRWGGQLTSAGRPAQLGADAQRRPRSTQRSKP